MEDDRTRKLGKLGQLQYRDIHKLIGETRETSTRVQEFQDGEYSHTGLGERIEIWELVRQGNFDPRGGCYVLVSYSKSLHSDRVLDW